MSCDAEKEREGECERRLARTLQQGDAKRPFSCTDLPFDVVLRILFFLPSPVLFTSRLCKAAHEGALHILAHRPSFVFQQAPPSSLCFLLPLDSPSTPLPCSFKLATSSFELAFASGNLLCLRRQYPSMLDICVCNIFRRWKVILPPIVHPSLAPRLLRRVFFEDCNVDSLNVKAFHVQARTGTHAGHAHQDFPPEYRIFLANSTYLLVYDSCVQQWSSPVYFPSHCSSQLTGTVTRPGLYGSVVKPPECFATSDGNLILTFKDCNLIFTFFSGTRALFKYEDQSFHDMELPFHPKLELAGYPASAHVDKSFNLCVCFPHVESYTRSSPQRGFQLTEFCKNEHGLRSQYTVCISDRGRSAGEYHDHRFAGGYYDHHFAGGYHDHKYERHLLHSHCFAHQGKVYALLMESEELRCIRDRVGQRRGNSEWQTLCTGDVEKIFCNRDPEFPCDQFFPRRSPEKLTLYSAHVDMTNWTMRVCKEADASAFLEYLGNKNSVAAGKLLLG